MASYTRQQIIDMTEGKNGSRYSRADFTLKDFSGLDLSNINFLSARTMPASDFTNANLDGSATRNATFEGVMDANPANIKYTAFANTSLNKINAYTSRYSKVSSDYNTVKFNQVIAKDSDFHNCIFRNAYLLDSIFYRCDFSFCDFTNTKFENFFSQTATRDTSITDCNFDDCLFLNTNFVNNVRFVNCSFKNARFIYTQVENFQNLDFVKCNLTGLTFLPYNGSTGNLIVSDCNISGALLPDLSALMLGNVNVLYAGTTDSDHAFRYLAFFN